MLKQKRKTKPQQTESPSSIVRKVLEKNEEEEEEAA